jgi:hypothetical protein
VWLAGALAGALALSGCGAHREAAARAPAPALPPTATSAGMVPQEAQYSFSDDVVQGDLVRPDGELLSHVRGSGAPAAAPLAVAETAQNANKAGQPNEAARPDAQHTGPLLIYTASFQLHVYEVEKAQAVLKEAAKRLGGFVAEQTDSALTLRVPSARFEEALAAVESTGKVRARHVQALDVGDQYRDLTLRLRTAEALRDRLEAMLARAAKVEEALQVERELERIVREIEQIKGQLRAMGDRIALSTIVVDFRPEARPDLDDSEAFRLPYPWLDELGLHHLLELRP